jgi:NTE family protein
MSEAERVEEAPSTGRVALVLQGGGALGAYQVGAYQALDEAGYCPTWFAGTSIGAINAAIMAGNARERRLEKLDEFWRTVGRSPLMMPPDGPARRVFNAWSAWQTMALGQPGFFGWRPTYPWFALPGNAAAISFYDTRPLRSTLEKVVDLDRINDDRAVRLSVGAVNVRTGRQVYFDSLRQKIAYEHIMASGALPPAFPPIEIDGEWYWDGGIVSNTPLDVIIDQLPRRSTLCFMVDLFDSMGPSPRVMEDVEARRKDIMYASRSERSIEAHRLQHNLRRAIMALWDALSPEAQKDPHLNQLADLGCTTTMHIVRIVHRSEPGELATKDYEFSSVSVSDHRRAGYQDTMQILENPTWLRPLPPDMGVILHELPRPLDNGRVADRQTADAGSFLAARAE